MQELKQMRVFFFGFVFLRRSFCCQSVSSGIGIPFYGGALGRICTGTWVMDKKLCTCASTAFPVCISSILKDHRSWREDLFIIRKTWC